MTGATVDRFFFFPLSHFSGFRSRAFLARFSTKSYFLIAICRKRFCILAFIRTLFRMKPETPKSIRRSLSDIRIFSNIFLYLIILLLFPPILFLFSVFKKGDFCTFEISGILTRQNAKKQKSPESLPSQYHEQYSRRGPHVLVWRSFKQQLFMRTAGREPAVCTHDP